MKTTQSIAKKKAMTILRVKKTVKKKATIPKVEQVLRYIVLDGEKHWLGELGEDQTAVCDSKAAVLKALERSDANSLWISRRTERTEELAKTLVELISSTTQRRATYGNLLTLEAAKADMHPTLQVFFSQVSSARDERRDVFIGGELNPELGTLVLVRGNLEQVIVPLCLFCPSGRATPDFSKFELGDYGHTLRFGDYEATADVVLWQVDQDYRQRAKAKERAHAAGFGPSLRRLRKQRGLSQSDFPNVARKTIYRIETGEIEKPHGTTLNRIAKTLGVAPEEIETY
jgi:DNA-binding XRE family transcriptional regulator